MPTYASKYYDPDKAHEYYLKNRDLKGYENRYGGSRGDGTSAASTSGYLSSYQRELKSASSDSEMGIEPIHNTSSSNSISGSLGYSDSSVSRSMDSYAKRKLDLHQKNLTQINGINSQIDNLRNKLRGMSAADKQANRESINDQIDKLKADIKSIRRKEARDKDAISDEKHKAQLEAKDAKQREKQQKKGGSTSGFNQKGKEAAAYIKKQMDDERDSIVMKTNADTDKTMLSKVDALVDRIQKLRSSGQRYNSKQFLSEVKSMLNEVKKTKAKTLAKAKADYVKKYKEEIDKLRQDDSMFTYWDKRKESEELYAKRKKIREQERAEREKLQDARDADRIANRKNRYNQGSSYEGYLGYN